MSDNKAKREYKQVIHCEGEIRKNQTRKKDEVNKKENINVKKKHEKKKRKKREVS